MGIRNGFHNAPGLRSRCWLAASACLLTGVAAASSVSAMDGDFSDFSGSGPGDFVPTGPAGFPQPGSWPGPVGGSPVGIPAGDYDGGAKTGAVLLAFFIPLVALIIALVLRSSESSPVRRASLRIWALVSGVWLGVGLLIAIIALAAVASSGPKVSHTGPCIGGPAMGGTGTPVGNGNYRFACEDGGTTIVHLGF